MAFNPLLLMSAVAVGGGVWNYRDARALTWLRTRGVLMSLAVITIMAGLGGVAVAVRSAYY